MPLLDKDDVRDAFQPMVSAAAIDWNALSYQAGARTRHNQNKKGASSRSYWAGLLKRVKETTSCFQSIY
jgi:hypothetical protein